MTDSFAAATAGMFAGPLATAATWTPPGDGAAAVAVRTVPLGAEALFRLSGADLPGLSAAYAVRAAEVAAPAVGGVLSVGGVAWTVVAPPVADARGLIWTLGVQRR